MARHVPAPLTPAPHRRSLPDLHRDPVDRVPALPRAAARDRRAGMVRWAWSGSTDYIPKIGPRRTSALVRSGPSPQAPPRGRVDSRPRPIDGISAAFDHAGAMTVISFNLCVSVVLAVLLARFFQEGQVITAFQLLVPQHGQSAVLAAPYLRRVWPPLAPQAASDGQGLPSSPVRSDPAPPVLPRGGVPGARPHPRRHIRCV